jgi:adenosylmethionine-8-amino-7-oxononanoate aminotransferase
MSTTEVAREAQQDWQSRALAHLWVHSDDAQWDELSTPGGLTVFTEAHGSTLIDVEGRQYLDGVAGLFLVNVGHGRTEIAQAMAEQASKIAYTASSTVANTASVALVELIASITPAGLDRIFLCSGGSEAVESALKIAKQAQVLRGFPKRYKVIARRGSYHGTTAGAMSLTVSASERFFGPFMPGVSKVPSPNHYRPNFNPDPTADDEACANALEQQILAEGPEYVAAFIGEPISVSNGTHIPDPIYWQRVREICDRYGVLLIMDEVITGYGRTGTMFAAERYGVVPDLMTMAKGLSSGYAPAAAVAVKSDVFEIFTEEGQALNHLLTFGGHAVAAAAAKRNIEILQDEELAARSAEVGGYLLELAQALGDHDTVGDVRGGAGLMCGIELVKNKDSKESWGSNHPFVKSLGRRVQERGLVTRVWDVLHLAPPLVVARDEVERMVAIVDESLTETEREFASAIAAAGASA